VVLGVLTRWKYIDAELVFNSAETIDSGALEKPSVRPINVSYNEYAVLRSDAIALPAEMDRVSVLGPVNVSRRIRADWAHKT